VIKMKTGLVIARYQPAHVSHMEVFNFAKEQGIDKLVVVKGSADKYRIPRHPFTPKECVDMVEMYLKKTGLEYVICPLDDVSQNIKQDDEELSEDDITDYIRYAKMLIDQLPPFQAAIVGNPTIGTPLKRLGYEVIQPKGEINCSATYIRREYTLRNDRCEDLLLPEQVRYMDQHGLYRVMKEIGNQEFRNRNSLIEEFIRRDNEEMRKLEGRIPKNELEKKIYRR
jgi:nicotinamide mononucleotide adenylyltransferase